MEGIVREDLGSATLQEQTGERGGKHMLHGPDYSLIVPRPPSRRSMLDRQVLIASTTGSQFDSEDHLTKTSKGLLYGGTFYSADTGEVRSDGKELESKPISVLL